MAYLEPQKSDPAKYAVGDHISLTQYLVVKSLPTPAHPNTFLVSTRAGDQFWEVGTPIIKESGWSASQFDETIRCTRMELAVQLERAGDAVFTVYFHKKASLGEAEAKLNGADTSTAAKRRQVAREILDGPPRTLIGRLKHVEEKMGRFVVEDLEVADPKNAERQVDARTIEWIIIKNKRYMYKDFKE